MPLNFRQHFVVNLAGAQSPRMATDTIWPGRGRRLRGEDSSLFGDGCVFLTVCANTALIGYFDTVGGTNQTMSSIFILDKHFILKIALWMFIFPSPDGISCA